MLQRPVKMLPEKLINSPQGSMTLVQKGFFLDTCFPSLCYGEHFDGPKRKTSEQRLEGTKLERNKSYIYIYIYIYISKTVNDIIKIQPLYNTLIRQFSKVML